MTGRSNKIFLVGLTGAGKTTVAKKLEENYGFKRSITVTTRQPRQNEVNGKDYHFIHPKIFKTMVDHNMFMETDSHTLDGKTYHYGSLKADYLDDEDRVFTISPAAIDMIKKAIPDSLVICLGVNLIDQYERLVNRGDDIETMRERMQKEAFEYADIKEKSDYIINTTEFSPDEVCEIIIQAVNIRKEYSWCENLILCDVPIGWRQLCLQTLKEVNEIVSNSNDLKEFKLLYMKEKYGSLRFGLIKGNNQIRDILIKYKQLCEKTCPVCGYANSVDEGAHTQLCKWCWNELHPEEEFY